MSTVAVVWLALTLVAVMAALSWNGEKTLIDVDALSSAAYNRSMYTSMGVTSRPVRANAVVLAPLFTDKLHRHSATDARHKQETPVKQVTVQVLGQACTARRHIRDKLSVVYVEIASVPNPRCVCHAVGRPVVHIVSLLEAAYVTELRDQPAKRKRIVARRGRVPHRGKHPCGSDM